MKRRILIQKLQSIGFKLQRNGGNHDVYTRGNDKEIIPRHKEIDERLAKAILHKWEL
ncbi:MAG: type II toxin-antitoxin system HicA family toxin [Hespellia sp.]|nr:type II toxin-antitoxin system HicA family toxin [Hespellia sp.]